MKNQKLLEINEKESLLSNLEVSEKDVTRKELSHVFLSESTKKKNEKYSYDVNILDSYYGDIKHHSYLSREEEVESFKELEKLKSQIGSIVINSEFSFPEIVDLSEQINEGSLKIKEVLEVSPFDDIYLADVTAKTEMFLGVVSMVAKFEDKLLSSTEKFAGAKNGSRSSKLLAANRKKYHGEIVKLLSKVPFSFSQIEKMAQDIIDMFSIILKSKKGLKQKLSVKLGINSKISHKIELYASVIDKEEMRNTVQKLRHSLNSYRSLKKNIVKANLRFVVSISKKFQNRGLQLLDLVQEGNIGLITAIDKYDYRRGIKFCSYAHWWIQQTIMKAIMAQGKNYKNTGAHC